MIQLLVAIVLQPAEVQGWWHAMQRDTRDASLSPTYVFAPACIESMGAWGESAKSLIHKIGARVREKTGEPRSTTFLIQRLAIDVQRGNVTSVKATIPSWGEVETCLQYDYHFLYNTMRILYPCKLFTFFSFCFTP